MSKLSELQHLLNQYGLWAKKRLGQHFLIDECAFDKIIEAADLKSTDEVIEVGPGTGFLTEQLISKVNRVIAVEYDADMVGILQERFKGIKNLEIIHSDILKFWIQKSGVKNHKYKVVANIPYYITSPLLKLFLQCEIQPSLMVVLVQKEVAEKVCGLTGKSVITIETQLFGKPEIVETVPAGSFYPAPKVDSVILKIGVYKKPLVPKAQVADFIRLVKHGFTGKRKMLSNTLAAGYQLKTDEARAILKKADINPEWRAENLEVGDWGNILTELNKHV